MSCNQNTILAEQVAENEKLTPAQKKKLIKELTNEDVDDMAIDVEDW